MFSPDIVSSDAFLEMPASSRDLYFQLGMYADDDGFVNPRKFMRMLGSSEDDLKILVAKRFVLPFQSGVLVIKHWKINNLVRKDWYKPTQYLEEKSTLFIKENGVYTDNPDNGVPLVNEPLTQVRLGKVSINKNVAETAKVVEVRIKEGQEDTERPKKLPKDEKALSLCGWAETRRGFKFTSTASQLGAIGRAKRAGITPTRLKARWEELEGETWRNGFDWVDVVKSFDKRV